MKDSNLLPKKSFPHITSDDSVSMNNHIVERPGTIPRKDYEDFARTLNDENPTDKQRLLKSSSMATIHTLRIPNKEDDLTNMRQTTPTGFNTARGSMDEKETKIRPVLFEKKILKSQDFYRLSDGFKKVFAKDP